ncbi:MAG TPA: DUF305 domain-containing protein [Micromonosporaceae bacterium]|nr:DUF305 domain-containing protein [Micromonosporaceae bacterium]
MAVTAIVLGVVLADDPGELPDVRVVQPGAPGEAGRTLSPDELASITPPPYNVADVAFFERMIPHHAQALEMTALVPSRTSNQDIVLLARRIEISQRDEIGLMQAWLTNRGLAVPAPHASHPAHDELMPGMLNDEQLAQLSRARGAEFDRLFLELMIYHHEGALAMANELYANGGGLEPESDRFARDVIADQSIEISRMKDLLAAMAS